MGKSRGPPTKLPEASESAPVLPIEVVTATGAVLDGPAMCRMLEAAEVPCYPLQRYWLLRGLAFMMERWREQPRAEAIAFAEEQLAMVLENADMAAAVSRATLNAPSLWPLEMLAGNYIPEGLYVDVAAKAPTVTRKGPAVRFTATVLKELGLLPTQAWGDGLEMVYKHMQNTFRVSLRRKQRAGH
jgi:hypothetical protein